MNLGLSGRRAVVGGGSAGLGLASAKALAEEGAEVLIIGRDAERLESARAQLGERVHCFVGDLSTREGARSVVGEAKRIFTTTDILIANVGGPPPGLAQSVDIDLLEQSIDRCLLAMVELCNGLLPGMVEQRWGRVLAITSTGVRQPLSAMVNSNAARAGLTGYLKTLAREVIGQGITVNSILPGSQMTARLESLIGERMEGYIANHPAGRAGEPEDFGKIATFLCSEPANYLTGVALSVDGGADSSLI